MKWIAVAILSAITMTGCASTENKTVEASIINALDHPVRIVASIGPFSKTVIIMPGQEWSGWIDPKVCGIWKTVIVIRK